MVSLLASMHISLLISLKVAVGDTAKPAVPRPHQGGKTLPTTPVSMSKTAKPSKKKGKGKKTASVKDNGGGDDDDTAMNLNKNIQDEEPPAAFYMLIRTSVSASECGLALAGVSRILCYTHFRLVTAASKGYRLSNALTVPEVTIYRSFVPNRPLYSTAG